jgi:dGTPase
VFLGTAGDHFRSRLTHTIEVSQVARAMARNLGLDEDLTEAIALAHDLGHTPYGHTGEDALDACMAEYGGFDHNAQALRIVTRLERHYARHDGLNLSWETLEGLVKHNGPLIDAAGLPVGRYAVRGIPGAIHDYDAVHQLDLMHFASLEAQVAAIADDIAYNAHDIDDGLRAGLIVLADLRNVSFLREQLSEIEAAYPGLDEGRMAYELTRRIITRFVEDVCSHTETRLEGLPNQNLDAVRRAAHPCVAFSSDFSAAEREIKGFLFPHVYRHPDVVNIRKQADRVVRDLFSGFMSNPRAMPEAWAHDLGNAPPERLARRVCDYIAGMTDRYALDEHRRLFDDTPDLR